MTPKSDIISEREFVEIEVRWRGNSTPDYYRGEAELCDVRSDVEGKEKFLRRARFAEEYLTNVKEQENRQSTIQPNSTDLYGGVAGAHMSLESFDFGGGASIRKTFAHVMAPFLLAFKKAEPGHHHPAPWKAAGGGYGFDVVLEIVLPRDERPTGFDRINTIWWLVALLRLRHPSGLRTPVISDTSFSLASTSKDDPIFWPMEMSPRGYTFSRSVEITEVTLEWVKTHYIEGAALMEDAAFSLAFLALDGAHSANSTSSAKLLIWAAIEALFRPGRTQITHRLSAAIATYLNSDLSARDREYQKIRRLYDARGHVIHAAEVPEASDVIAAFSIAQACFLNAIERRELPNTLRLLERWQSRS
jgi:hypothetical protein